MTVTTIQALPIVRGEIVGSADLYQMVCDFCPGVVFQPTTDQDRHVWDVRSHAHQHGHTDNTEVTEGTTWEQRHPIRGVISGQTPVFQVICSECSGTHSFGPLTTDENTHAADIHRHAEKHRLHLAWKQSGYSPQARAAWQAAIQAERSWHRARVL